MCHLAVELLLLSFGLAAENEVTLVLAVYYIECLSLFWVGCFQILLCRMETLIHL